MSESQVRFRYDVLPSDRDTVRDIVDSTGFFNPAEVDIAVELVDDHLAKGTASGYWFVFAESPHGVVHGYSSYGPIAGTAESFDLYWIAVHNNYRNQGLGRVLLTESERLIAAAGGHRIYVETSSRDHYLPTRAFYEKCGYEIDAVIKHFYAPDDHKVIYLKVV